MLGRWRKCLWLTLRHCPSILLDVVSQPSSLHVRTVSKNSPKSYECECTGRKRRNDGDFLLGCDTVQTCGVSGQRLFCLRLIFASLHSFSHWSSRHTTTITWLALKRLRFHYRRASPACKRRETSVKERSRNGQFAAGDHWVRKTFLQLATDLHYGTPHFSYRIYCRKAVDSLRPWLGEFLGVKRSYRECDWTCQGQVATPIVCGPDC